MANTNFMGLEMKNILLLLIFVAILLTSCDGKKIQDIKETSKLSDKPFIISNTWMRVGAKNRNSAAFMKITNNMEVDDTLFAVESDLAKVTELHETYEKENDMMGMRHIDFLIIPNKSVVYLKPGSFHIMLIGLNKDLTIGDSSKIRLSFKRTGDSEIFAEVK